MDINYKQKFNIYVDKTIYQLLTVKNKKILKKTSFLLKLTFQEFNQLVNACRDLEMWETDIESVFKCLPDFTESEMDVNIRKEKEDFLQQFYYMYNKIKETEKEYFSKDKSIYSAKNEEPVLKKTDKKIYGLCPVASSDTLCCRLNTIDAVECCSFNCTYCSIQTFYNGRPVFDKDFETKLKSIKIEQDKFMRFGSGQSSDSLIWGNRYNILGSLFDFARAHPHILLELKTKSDNVNFLFDMDVPENTVCSWSLNPDVIIQNEELNTPSLKKRLEAAEKVSGKGVKVGFHFHPMIYYKNWMSDYSEIALSIIKRFAPESVLFVSFGSLTFIKPVIREIRKAGRKTKILQMPFASDPKGKITYPDDIKIKLYKHIYNEFSEWHKKVYFYFCMEKKSIWEEVFSFAYESNEEFEADFGRKTMKKINPRLHQDA